MKSRQKPAKRKPECGHATKYTQALSRMTSWLKRDRNVRGISLFGSVYSKAWTPSSDVDMIVLKRKTGVNVRYFKRYGVIFHTIDFTPDGLEKQIKNESKSERRIWPNIVAVCRPIYDIDRVSPRLISLAKKSLKRPVPSLSPPDSKNQIAQIRAQVPGEFEKYLRNGRNTAFKSHANSLLDYFYQLAHRASRQVTPPFKEVDDDLGHLKDRKFVKLYIQAIYTKTEEKQLYYIARLAEHLIARLRRYTYKRR